FPSGRRAGRVGGGDGAATARPAFAPVGRVVRSGRTYACSAAHVRRRRRAAGAGLVSSVGVGTGWPDGEDRPMPHGGTLITGSALSVNGATDLPGLGAYMELAGYRSLVVVVNNKGTRDLTVTPRWDFYEGPGNLNPTDAQL